MRGGHVFISHASDETGSAQELARLLRASGLEVWLDVERLKPGDRWMYEIEAAIRDAAGVVVFVGASGIRAWVEMELRCALEREVKERRGPVQEHPFRLILILGKDSDPANLPLFASGYQYVDCRAGLSAERIGLIIQTLTGQPPVLGALPRLNRAPFLGLQPFTADDAVLFYGRDTEVEDLVMKLRDSRFVAVLGDSGCGKSSLIQAGLVPALIRGRGIAQGEEEWRICVSRPGRDPFGDLAGALVQLKRKNEMSDAEAVAFQGEIKREAAKGTDALAKGVAALRFGPHVRPLLVIDQFEELFTSSIDAEESERYIDTLLRPLRNSGSDRLRVLIALRADFYSQCWRFPNLLEKVKWHYAVPPLSNQQMRSAIEKPLMLTAARMEPGLAQALLAEAGNERGSLPLLQHALRLLWEERAGDILTNAEYQNIGRLDGAIEKYADRVYNRLDDDDDRDLARKIFIELTTLGEGTEDTRRIAMKSELLGLGGPGSNAEKVLGRLVDARLIVTGLRAAVGPRSPTPDDKDEFVEVAHEALIRRWPRLCKWIADDRENVKIKRRLSDAARDWESFGKHPDSLWRGAALAHVEEWVRSCGGDLPAAARAFLDASCQARDLEIKEGERHRRAELEEARRHNRRQFALLCLTTALLMIASIAALLAYRAQTRAVSRDLAAQAALMLEREPHLIDRATLLAIESMRRNPSASADQDLRAAVNLLPRLTARLRHDHRPLDVQFSPDGSHAITIFSDDTGRAAGALDWDIARGEVVRRLSFKSDQARAAWTAEEPQILCTTDLANGARVQVLTFPSGAVVFERTSSDDYRALGGLPWNGTYLGTFSSPRRISVQRTGGATPTYPVEASGSISGAQFSKDGERLLIDTDRGLEIANVRNRSHTIVAHSEPGFHHLPVAAVAKGAGLRLAYAVFSSPALGEAVIGDETGRDFIRRRHEGYGESVAISSDANLFTTTSLSRTVRVWDVQSGEEFARFTHDDDVSKVVFDRQAAQIATISGNDVRVFSIRQKPWVEIPIGSSVAGLAFSSDGRQVAVGSSHISGAGGVAVFDVTRGREIVRLQRRCCGGTLMFDPADSFLAAVTSRGSGTDLRIWSTKDWAEVAAIPLGPIGGCCSTPVVFTRTGITTMAQRDGARRLFHWAAPRFTSPEEMFDPPEYLYGVSADGSRAIVEGKGALRVFETRSGKQLWQLPAPGKSYFGFASSRNRLAFVTDDGIIDVTTLDGAHIARIVQDDVSRVSLAHNEPVIAITARDGSVRVWNLKTNSENARLLHPAGAVAFSPDDRLIASGGNDQVVRISPWRSQDLLDVACGVLARNLTRQEWNQYIGGRYRKTCPNLP